MQEQMKNEPAGTSPAALEVIQLLSSRGMTICTCESLTAGLCASTLASVPGASKALLGGLVTYATSMKTVLAQVPVELIERYGAVSAECAACMASQTRQLMDADYALSFTGNAGPDTMEGKPAGLVFCSIADRQKITTIPFHIRLPRNALRAYIVEEMLQILAEKIREEVPDESAAFS